MSEGPALNLQQTTIGSLSTDDQMQACVRLQQPVWQSSELEVVPHHPFVVAHRIGGQVLAAFHGERMVACGRNSA